MVEEIFSSHISDNRYKIWKTPKTQWNKQNNPGRKWVKYMHRHFTEDYMANKNMRDV